MANKKELLILLLILFIAATLRFYNLMHDAPYFFNPDERNMANAITQFRLPNNLSQIPICLISQISPIIRNDPGSSPSSNDPGSSTTNNCNLNPNFFAYGQFPLYLAFISDQVIQSFWQVPINGTRPESHWDPGQARMTTFPSAIFWLRFWSALSSVLTVLFVYLISRKLFTFHFSLFTAAATSFTPGLIQSAHFGTTESLLTFFFLASVYLSLKLSDSPFSISHLCNLSNLRNIFFLSLTIGLALGSKLTGLFFFVPVLLTLMIRIIRVILKRRKGWIIVSLFHCFIVSLITIGSLFFAVVASPYNLIDLPDFKSAVFGYERDIATGKYEAFYTRQFVNTTPILFQAEKIFPYALGWPVFILGTLGFLLMNLKLIQNLILPILGKYQILNIKYQKYIANIKNLKIFNFLYVYLIFDFSFLIYLIPNSFLFAKWTRFMTPILPLFAIFSAFALFKIYSVFNVNRSQFPIRVPFGRFQFPINVKISEINKLNNLLGYWVIGLLVFIGSITPGMAFMSIYTREDTRVQASKWIYKNIPNNSYILSETANVVDIPLSIPNYTVISFDFYHIDKNQTLFNELINHLEKADYIFIPSRRIFSNYMRLPKTYPLVTKYYQLLFSGALGFEKIAEISSFPQLTINHYSLTIPDEDAEETFTVFDHPVIRIYKKVQQLTRSEYEKILKN